MNQAGQTFQYDALADMPQFPGELPGDWAFQNLPNPARKEALPVQAMQHVFFWPTDEVPVVPDADVFFQHSEQEWHHRTFEAQAAMAATGTYRADELGPRDYTLGDVVDVLKDLGVALQPNTQNDWEVRRNMQKIVHHLKRLF